MVSNEWTKRVVAITAPGRGKIEMAGQYPTVIIVMGVSGCGKTTLGELLAENLNATYLEGDSFHSDANVEKMRQGIPLTDEDRFPWLTSLHDRIVEAKKDDRPIVLTCSALKRSYRDLLRGGSAPDPDVRIVHLTGTRELLTERMSARTGHYMPTSLLDSQLATLERPLSDENVIELDIAADPDDLLSMALDGIRSPA